MTAPGIRERNRRDLTTALLDAARQQLGEVGAAALSLRSVAREVGMVPSAVYRYFPSRDHLLTALLIEGYEGLASALESAEAGARPSDAAGRWRAVCHAARDWSAAHPQEWSLLYGSPVPGYGAPTDTVAPVERIVAVFGRVFVEVGAGERPPTGPRRLPSALRRDLAELKASPMFAVDGAPADVPDLALLRAVGAWVQVFGLISFERFGQFQNGIDDLDGLFAAEVDILWRTLAGV
ncbi:TetR/AcrR family transcriptional regulator [Jatrophihabitans sp. YIM 134969]